jgi:hypothetical protein
MMIMCRDDRKSTTLQFFSVSLKHKNLFDPAMRESRGLVSSSFFIPTQIPGAMSHSDFAALHGG